MNPESKQAAARRLRHERTDMEQAIVAATINWGRLEDRMALILHRLLSRQMGGYGPGLAIYFTPENAATRFAIVDAAIRHAILPLDEKDPLREFTGSIREEWGSFFNSLGRARATRNSIIHGSIRTVQVGRSKREVIRLAPSAWDATRLFLLKEGQVPGLSPLDVEAAAKKFTALASRANLFEKAVSYFHHDQRALPPIVVELKASRPKDDGQTGDAQTPPEQ